MAGSEMRPMVTTVAPTMPVEAANRPPTMQTETPSPPRKGPHSRAIVSSRSSAIFERSSTTPIKTKIGTAIRVFVFGHDAVDAGRQSRDKGRVKVAGEDAETGEAEGRPRRGKRPPGKPDSSTAKVQRNMASGASSLIGIGGFGRCGE